MINKDFFAALDELEKTRRINKSEFIASLEAGLASAYKKENAISTATRFLPPASLCTNGKRAVRNDT